MKAKRSQRVGSPEVQEVPEDDQEFELESKWE